MAKAALFLASDDSSFMTGAVARRRRRHHRRLRHPRVGRDRWTRAALDVDELERADRRRRDRHRARRASPTCRAGSWASGSPATSSSTTCSASGDRGLQLPARGRRRHDAAARLPLRQLGPGLRRLQRACPTSPTLRLVPWLEKTALVLCDLVDEETGEPVEVSPRQILRRQVERAAALGLHGEDRRPSSSSSCSRTSYEEAAAKRLPRPHAALATGSRTTTSSRRPGTSTSSARSATAWTAPACRSSSPRARPAAASTRSTSRYADALEMADRHAIYKNGAKEIAALNGRSLTFMAKYSMDEVGLVVPHPLERVGRRRRRRR